MSDARAASAFVALLLAACGGPTRGDLPPGDTEIGRVAARCPRPHYCGDVGYVDCGAAVDGPAYFFERKTGRVTGACGGACMVDEDGHCAKQCPPRAWTCGGVADEKP